MKFIISPKTSFFLVFFNRWKRNKFQISMKFDFKNGKTNFESLFSSSFDELHCSTIVHINHMKHMFQDLSFYCTKKVPKKHNQFFHFCRGGGTHFLVLAHTLMYIFWCCCFLYALKPSEHTISALMFCLVVIKLPRGGSVTKANLSFCPFLSDIQYFAYFSTLLPSPMSSIFCVL